MRTLVRETHHIVGIYAGVAQEGEVRIGDRSRSCEHVCRTGRAARTRRGAPKQKITKPTAIQVAALPWLFEGKDAYLYAPTGTGKTLAYLLPVFARIVPAQAATQVLIVAPTHELAIQIQRVCGELSTNVKTILLVGGTSLERQLEKLKKRPHVAIGTLGRIDELIRMGKLKTDALKAVIVDEADRLWVRENAKALKSLLAPGRQLICASATIPAPDADIPDLEVLQAGDEPVNENIEHFYLVCEEREKPAVLRKLLHAVQPERAIVFVKKGETVEDVAPARAPQGAGRRAPCRRGQVPAQARHGGIPQRGSSRDGGVRRRRARPDILGVTHVINLDAPTQSMAYLHRVGRSARGDSSGQAVTLVTEGELNLIRRYEAELGILIQAMRLREGR